MVVERLLELVKDLVMRPTPPSATGVHVREALEWIYRAQDTGKDRGVSHSYVLDRGWMPSYPETTGYIIPTLLNLADWLDEPEPRRRALEMAAWEIEVQLPQGAIPSLATGDPVVFDTGQVIFGWVAAFEAFGEKRFLDAALRAGDWLISTMDKDGCWRQWMASTTGLTYNARTAWALAELGRVAEIDRFKEAARYFLNWSLTQEHRDGWFSYNCLDDNTRPLLHTIAYTARGQLEAGVLLDEPRFIEAAERTARALCGCVGDRGRMAGRFTQTWDPAVRWVCLTGVAQTSVLWSRLARVTGDGSYRDAATRALEFLKSTHDVASRRDELRGGIRGSYPVSGAYCRYRLPNWATKFFLDALLHAEGALIPRFKG